MRSRKCSSLQRKGNLKLEILYTNQEIIVMNYAMWKMVPLSSKFKLILKMKVIKTRVLNLCKNFINLLRNKKQVLF